MKRTFEKQMELFGNYLIGVIGGRPREQVSPVEQPSAPALPPVPLPEKDAPRSGRDPALEAKAHAMLHALGAVNLANRVEVHWNPRLKSTAGTASPMRGIVRLNPRLLEISDKEVDRTLRHELAHLLAQERAGYRRIAQHGAEWAQACADLGLPGESRCHQLPLLSGKRMKRNYFYQCPNCGVVLGRVRAMRRIGACKRCCDRFNRGKYSATFKLQRIAPPPTPQSASDSQTT
jgi:predicted SprT family Zn-dependent metalloprotease